jgi:hypothetical protein
MSLAAFAVNLGTTAAKVSDIEHGRRHLGPRRAGASLGSVTQGRDAAGPKMIIMGHTGLSASGTCVRISSLPWLRI